MFKSPDNQTIIRLLRFRTVFLLLSPLFLYAALLMHHDFIITREFLRISQFCIQHIYLRYRWLQTIFCNLAAVFEGRIVFLAEPIISAISLILTTLLVLSVSKHIAKALNKKSSSLISLSLVASCSFAYFLIASDLSVLISVGLTLMIASVYFFDFIVFEKNMLKEPVTRKGLSVFFVLTPVFTEIFCIPAYLRFLSKAAPSKKNELSMLIMRHLHFSVVVMLLMIIFNGYLQNNHFIKMAKVKNGSFYGSVFSEKSSKLFLYDSLHDRFKYYDINAQERGLENIYHPSFFSELIEINEEREELYAIDRKYSQLLILDMNNFAVKNSIHLKGIGGGDSCLVAGNDTLFIVNENPMPIYKIDLKTMGVTSEDSLRTSLNFLAYNKNREVFYANEWRLDPRNPEKGFQYFIYEIDAKTLKTLRKVPVPGPGWDMVVTGDDKKLFCAFPFVSLFRSYIYVFDTESLRLIRKIKAPFGTRAIAIDEKRDIIFAGSALNNTIEAISLRSGRLLRMYKAGDHSLKKIALDKKNQTIFVTTKFFGFFQGHYGERQE